MMLNQFKRMLTSPNFWLVIPATLLLIIFFIIPIATMIRISFDSQMDSGALRGGYTFGNYIRFFTVGIYTRVLANTFLIGLATTLIAAWAAYPLAWVIARGSSLSGRIIMLVVVMPLLVNIVARTFGWRIILGGMGPWAMLRDSLGFGRGVPILYSETAVIIGSLHVFLPLMVFPLANAIGAIPRALEESAAALGARPVETFIKIVLPLSLPGLGAGAILVFTLTSSSYVLPAILGGDFSKMLGTLVQEQLLAVSNQPFGAAIATVLMLMNLIVIGSYTVLANRKLGVWTSAPEHKGK